MTRLDRLTRMRELVMEARTLARELGLTVLAADLGFFLADLDMEIESEVGGEPA